MFAMSLLCHCLSHFCNIHVTRLNLRQDAIKTEGLRLFLIKIPFISIFFCNFVPEMIRMEKSWGVLLFLIVVLLTVSYGWQDKDCAQEKEVQEQRDATVVTPQDSRHYEATLTDATNLYRVCSSRPQRILSTHASKTERTANPCGFVRVQIVKSLHFLHDSRRRLETAPFCLSASCLYYVIALRHIIR